MNEQPMPLNEEDLHAYVDGRLEGARLAEIEERIAADATVADRVRAYRAQNMGLHNVFDSVLEEPVPIRISQTLARKPQWQASAAAAAFWLAIGGVGGYLFHGESSVPVAAAMLAERAAVAHTVYVAEVLHPVEVTADQKEHLVAWLSKRLGKNLRTPDFSPYGYQLIGGRLLPGESGPAAQFMYQQPQGARLTLYVSTPAKGAKTTAFRHQQKGGVQVLYWVDRDLDFALVGDVSAQHLAEMAHGVYESLGF